MKIGSTVWQIWAVRAARLRRMMASFLANLSGTGRFWGGNWVDFLANLGGMGIILCLSGEGLSHFWPTWAAREDLEIGSNVGKPGRYGKILALRQTLAPNRAMGGGPGPGPNFGGPIRHPDPPPRTPTPVAPKLGPYRIPLTRRSTADFRVIKWEVLWD